MRHQAESLAAKDVEIARLCSRIETLERALNEGFDRQYSPVPRLRARIAELEQKVTALEQQRDLATQMAMRNEEGDRGKE